jgi:dTDP-4-dehydrorhamnose reductase
MVSSPTYVKDLAGAVAMLIEKPAYGTYHLTNAGFADRFGIRQGHTMRWKRLR